MTPSSSAQRSGSPTTDDVVPPAVIGPDHVQDRELSTAAGSPRGYRRLDGLDWLIQRKSINGDQLEAGRRLQADYELSQLRGGARSGGERTSGRHSYDLPDSALDAGKRVKAALAVLPPELLGMVGLFLFPDFEEQPLSLKLIAKMVREDERAIPFGVRVALSLLARHYGN